jgi:pimeloyl-ACP methyl ester carboxylesterase
VTLDQAETLDGQRIAVHSAGSGPGVVVVHGSAVSAGNYARLAGALAGRFTVHRYDRRGRGSRGPVDASHGIASDVDDLRTVLSHTSSRIVLAHSYGGLVALRGASTLPIDRLVVYDAAVSIEGSFPSAFIEPFAAAAADFPMAMAILSKGLGSAGAFSRLPIAVQRVAARGFAATAAGREWRTMVPSAVVEAREVLAHDSPADAYAGIPAEVLLVTGARSPAYFTRASEALARAEPAFRHVVVPKTGHNALMDARPPLVECVAGDRVTHLACPVRTCITSGGSPL